MNRCRKDYRDLTPDERDRFIAALYHVKSTGIVDSYADDHYDLFGPIHGGSNFCPWHREFILRFEDQLRTYDSRVTLPYWNWMDDRSTTSLLWSNSFLGQFDSAWSLNRALGSSVLPTAEQVEEGMNTTPFPDFRSFLEVTLHNAPHRWVSGTMVSRRSPADPVFFLHHNFVDLLWAQWQIRNPGLPFVASVNLTVSGFTVDSGPGNFVVLMPTTIGNPDIDQNARVWITHTGTAEGDITLGHCNIDCVETGESFLVMLSANTVARQSSAVVMLLDQSNSMNRDSGITGKTRADVLSFSAPPFVDVIGDESAVAVSSFDHDQHPEIGMTDIGDGRILVNSAITGYAPNPNGWTSIGEALAHAADLLNPVTEHPIKATVVLTDGRESHGHHDRRYISDVADLINDRVFAIGLGTAEALSPNSLSALCNDTDGYLLMTGQLNDDTYFRLAKYYQQILAGVTNHEMVLDPEGWIRPKQKIRIPFWLSEADVLAKVVLLTPAPYTIDYALETPSGDTIHPNTAVSNPAVTYRTGGQVALYDFSLPLPSGKSIVHSGRWHALLHVDEDRFRKYINSLDNFPVLIRQALAHGVRYSVSVQAFSGISLKARVSQTSFQPGADLVITSSLDQGGMPLDASTSMLLDVERPDGSSSTLSMTRLLTGHYSSIVHADLSGIYNLRVHAEGRSVHRQRFTREQSLTGSVWQGGDNPPPSNTGESSDDRDSLCELLSCLLEQKSILKKFEKMGIDIDDLTNCFKRYCQKRSLNRKP